MWIMNHKISRPAQELLMAVAMNCNTHSQQDIEVIGGFTKFRFKNKPNVNLYLAVSFYEKYWFLYETATTNQFLQFAFRWETFIKIYADIFSSSHFSSAFENYVVPIRKTCPPFWSIQFLMNYLMLEIPTTWQFYKSCLTLTKKLRQPV